MSLFSVGDRTYNNVDEVKTKIENQDSFIETLKSEKQQLEQEIATFKEQLNSAQTQQGITKDDLQSMFNQVNQQQQPAQQETTNPQFDMASLQKQMQEQMQQQFQQLQQQQLSEANTQSAMQYSKEQFGDDFGTKLLERGKELNMDQAAIDQMAASNPTMFKELFKAPPKPDVDLAPSSSRQPTTSVNKDVESLMDDWSDREKFWSSASKVDSLRKMQAELEPLIRSGQIEV